MFQEKYRDFYIRTAFDTPFGKWAVANGEKGEVILQHVPLLETPPKSLIDQYLLLDHPLIIPYLDVYQEPGAIVFIRPYMLIENLIHRIPMDQETANLCCAQLADLETYLKNQPIPMKILYHPENIGLTDEGELRVFLCGDASFMQWDFSDQEAFKEILIGGNQKEGQKAALPEIPSPDPAPLPVRELKPQVMVSRRTAILGAIAAGILCFGAGLGLMKVMEEPEETATVQAETSNQKTESPAPAPKPASDPALSEDSTPPTQDDINQSRIVAEKFVSSLDRDDHQGILKKKARSMTVLPTMQAEQIDSRPGEITWRIEAEVFHSDGNMEGDMYRTTFRVVTVKENGSWQVEDAEVTGEKKE